MEITDALRQQRMEITDAELLRQLHGEEETFITRDVLVDLNPNDDPADQPRGPQPSRASGGRLVGHTPDRPWPQPVTGRWGS